MIKLPGCAGVLLAAIFTWTSSAAESAPPIPRFSIENMDRSADLAADFYQFSAGGWMKTHDIPADKSRWGSFDELRERNWYLIHEILEDAAHDRSVPKNSPKRQVGDFFLSAMDTNRIEKLGFKPIERDLKRIEKLNWPGEVTALLADFHARGIDGLFNEGAPADAKNSSVYHFKLGQGGLGLPDRDYYLDQKFADKRDKYREHMTRMFKLLGEPDEHAARDAQTVLAIETDLAKASRTRVDLRDPNLNYNKLTRAEFERTNAASFWPNYFAKLPTKQLADINVGQPEFFVSIDRELKQRPVGDWKTYLRWHLLRSAAPYLHSAVEQEHFEFYGKELRGQPQQEPRWQRAARIIDAEIGEALGQLFVEKHFPPAARARMAELIANLRVVFHDRLTKVPWMSAETRAKALVKFDRFTDKIGYPDKFRDYSTVKITPDDLLGNVQRASAFEHHRTLVRVGKPVDKAEWHMTPQTVNAYFNPLQNEIVFPAGILQPPFFDIEVDDPINYGAIGMVIGHEITHGYDDEGRKYDANGNLNNWWTEQDAKEFEARAQKVVNQYNAYQPLPGVHVNGKLTLGENLADLGGCSIAYEAMQRALAKDPAKRKNIDGFTPEQRFFISVAQVWRTKARPAEVQRLITIDPHSPGQFRAIGASVNMPEFYDAFGIKSGAPMWREPELRAKIW